MTIVTSISDEQGSLVLDDVEYHFAWGADYRLSPEFLSFDDVLTSLNDHVTSGYSFDGTQYVLNYACDAGSFDHQQVVQCPGPVPPPLHGPSLRDSGDYWARRTARFVFDETAEHSLRRTSQRLNTPGYVWCEFA